ncbi:hypothetical protein P7K49_033316 [Saguinus oedipus]|uniref:Uncharacterized protein n=1 Tax=Saguinus oedipus TaxID=9490 RepID=A0ABQ9TRK6_SAGOE|nr:hypothetical protein P7K49_033316 [Saguinus oedipus]
MPREGSRAGTAVAAQERDRTPGVPAAGPAPPCGRGDRGPSRALGNSGPRRQSRLSGGPVPPQQDRIGSIQSLVHVTGRRTHSSFPCFWVSRSPLYDSGAGHSAGNSVTEAEAEAPGASRSSEDWTQKATDPNSKTVRPPSSPD